jgi:hypothetical protein
MEGFYSTTVGADAATSIVVLKSYELITIRAAEDFGE